MSQGLATFALVKISEANPLNCNNGEEIPADLFELMMEYAKTPIEDRKEETQYYLKSICPYTFDLEEGYLNHHTIGVTDIIYRLLEHAIQSKDGKK